MSLNIDGKTEHGKFTPEELAQVRALVKARDEFKRKAKDADTRIKIIELNAFLRSNSQAMETKS